MNLFEIGDNLITQLGTLLLAAALVVAVGFFLFMAIRSRFAWAPMLLAAGAAAFVIWLVNNVDGLGRQIVDNTIRNTTTTDSAPAELIEGPPSPPQA